MEDICFYDLQQLSDLIRRRTVSCEFVLNSFYERISQYNKQINSVVDIFPYEALLEEARLKDHLLQRNEYEGPLHGIPMTIKDSFDVKGLISTLGNPLLKRNRPRQDAELVSRLKRNGAIILGKTNLPLFSMDWKSENWWYGRTLNPYDVTRTVGGSSGGSAAAVAARFSPVEIGSDAGGSIRVPAHFCGVCGFRPSEGVISNEGHMRIPHSKATLRYITVPGPIAKTVRDLEILYDILADGRIASNSVDQQPSEASSLKIAFSMQLGGVEINESYKQQIESFLERLDTEGFQIFECRPDYDDREAYLSWATIIGLDMKKAMPGIPFKAFLASAFIRWRFRDKLWARGTYQAVSGNSKACQAAFVYKEKMTKAFNSFFDKYDAWITPVCPTEAFIHQPTGQPLPINNVKLDYTHSMGTYNFCTALPGHPICVIPIGKLENGLPVGIQIHAKKFSDKRLLSIARLIEKVISGHSIPEFEGRPTLPVAKL